ACARAIREAHGSKAAPARRRRSRLRSGIIELLSDVGAITTTPTLSPSPVEVGYIRLRPLNMPNLGKPEFGWGGEQTEPAAPSSIHFSLSSRPSMRCLARATAAAS